MRVDFKCARIVQDLDDPQKQDIIITWFKDRNRQWAIDLAQKQQKEYEGLLSKYAPDESEDSGCKSVCFVGYVKIGKTSFIKSEDLSKLT